MWSMREGDPAHEARRLACPDSHSTVRGGSQLSMDLPELRTEMQHLLSAGGRQVVSAV